MNPPKLTIEELSRFIDNELSESELEEVSRKLTECPTSEQLLNRLRELTQQVSSSILNAAPVESKANTEECLTEDDIIRLVEHQASPAELYQAEQHIANCRHCLLLVLQNIRTAVSMNSNNWNELPEEVRADSRISVVSRIKRPQHCCEHTSEQIGEIRFNLNSNKTQIFQEFSKGIHTVQLIIKRVSAEIASLEITFLQENKPKTQIELTLIITPDGKQIFRGLTGQNGKTLIRRVQPNNYLLRFKELDAVISVIISDGSE